MNVDFINEYKKAEESIRAYFNRQTEQELLGYGYKEILKVGLTFINEVSEEYNWNVDDIFVIDKGDYQGTILFVVPEEAYQPDIYLITKVWYGSCSHCDTLMGLQEGTKEEMVYGYMRLLLHMMESVIIY